MKPINETVLHIIKERLPNIPEKGINAFYNIYQVIEKYYKKSNIVFDFSIYCKGTCKTIADDIMVIDDFYIDYILQDEIPELSKDDTERLAEYYQILNDAIEEESKSFLNTKNFFLAEYIKRNYYINKVNSGCKNLEELPEFLSLSIWRKQREKRIAQKAIKADCDNSNCYFRKEKGAAKKNLRHPFFYNLDCKPPYQYNSAPYCPFKLDILSAIIALHNEKNPDFSDRLNDYRLKLYKLPDANIKNWSKESRKHIAVLHDITYEYGLLVFDLFGLASPYKILANSAKNNTEFHIEISEAIQKEIIKEIQAEFFLKKGNSDKLSDPKNMAVIRRDPDKPFIDLSLLEQFIQKYDFIIGIDSDIRKDDFSIKKEVLKIKKALQSYVPHTKYEFDPIKNQTQFIVFGFNPSAESFGKRIKKYIEDVILIINAYKTATMPLNKQIKEYQPLLKSIHERIQYVKSYQDRDRSRLIGLYIWDQVHLLNKPRTEAIKSFADSKLFEKIMKLTDGEIEQRNISAKARGKEESFSNQEERDEIYRNYEYANCCIEKGAILTGEECERMLYPNRHL